MPFLGMLSSEAHVLSILSTVPYIYCSSCFRYCHDLIHVCTYATLYSRTYPMHMPYHQFLLISCSTIFLGLGWSIDLLTFP